MQKGKVISAVVAALVVIYAACTATVVKEGQEATLTGEVAFDAKAVATKLWEEKANKYFTETAIDLNTLIAEANGDFKNVAKKYGRYSMGDHGELSFVVKGSGTIDAVKNKLRSGYLGIKVDGNDSDIKSRLQIGPVFKGTAVRDSFALISFKDYQNQIEWADVSLAFHDLISKEVLSKLDMNTMEGKQVDFVGCFTVKKPDLLVITPVTLTVK